MHISPQTGSGVFGGGGGGGGGVGGRGRTTLMSIILR